MGYFIECIKLIADINLIYKSLIFVLSSSAVLSKITIKKIIFDLPDFVSSDSIQVLKFLDIHKFCTSL